MYKRISAKNRSRIGLSALIGLGISLAGQPLSRFQGDDNHVLFGRNYSGFSVGDLFTGTAHAQAAPEDDAEGADLGKDASTEINVKNADLAAIVRIFSKKTKRNYILDENIKGKVSIYLPGKVSSDEAIRILDSVLALKGFTSVPISENLWKIVPARDAKQTTIPTIIDGETGEDPSAAMVTRIVNLKFVDAEDLQKLLTQLISPNGLINAYTGTNSLMIIDNEDNIRRVVDIISAVDVPFSDREMTIIPIKHADAKELADKLNEILGTGGDKDAQGAAGSDLLRDPRRAQPVAQIVPPPVPPPGGAVQNLTASGGTTIAARAREPKIISDERTNSILIVADEETTARIRALVSQLDSKVDLSGSKFYVYRCQHASADELAQVLSGLTGGGSTTDATGRRTGSSLSRGDRELDGLGGAGFGNTGSRERGDRFNRTQNRLQNQQRVPGRARSENDPTGTGAGSFSLGEEISITADPATNSLIINANKQDYERVRSLLEQLDVKRRQVLVEAMLLEVDVEESQALSTDFVTSAGGADGGAVIKSDFANLATLLANPVGLSNFSVAAASSGTLSLPGDITIPTHAILVNAVQNNSSANVLSSPTILTTDNEEAEIVVGQNIPFVASTSTNETNLNNTFNQIDRQDVGITLRLTPQISSEDYVKLRIFTEVSNVLAATLASDLGPTTTIRTSETTVITKDGQMIVIGGLMSDDVSATDVGVPYLKNIPVLGHAFRFTSEARRRTNLLIFITPRVVKDQFDARDNTLMRRDRLQYELEEEDMFPRREQILQSPDLDKVSEAKLYEGTKPGTILAPEGYGESDDAGLEAEQSWVTEGAADAQDGGTLELKVAPRLPGEGKDETLIERDLERPSSAPSTKMLEAAPEKKLNTAGQDLKGPGARFVVLEVVAGDPATANTPFKLNSSGYLAVEVPAGSGTPAQQFFKVGQTYQYLIGKHGVTVVPLGVFPKAEEAERMFSGLQSSDWYTLSPHEIMNLGKKPWVQTQN